MRVRGVGESMSVGEVPQPCVCVCIWLGIVIGCMPPYPFSRSWILPPITYHQYDGTASLHLAAGYGHIEVVRLLLDRGASVNATERVGGVGWGVIGGCTANTITHVGEMHPPCVCVRVCVCV